MNIQIYKNEAGRILDERQDQAHPSSRPSGKGHCAKKDDSKLEKTSGLLEMVHDIGRC